MDNHDMRTAIADGIHEELRAYPVVVVKPVCDYNWEIYGPQHVYARRLKLFVYDDRQASEYHVIIQAWDGNRIFFGIEDPDFFSRVAAEIASLLNVERKRTVEAEASDAQG